MLRCLSNPESIQKPDASDVLGNEGLVTQMMWTSIISACHLFVFIVQLRYVLIWFWYEEWVLHILNLTLLDKWFFYPHKITYADLIVMIVVSFGFLWLGIMNKSEKDSYWFKTLVDQLCFIFKTFDLLLHRFYQELLLARLQLFIPLHDSWLWVDNSVPFLHFIYSATIFQCDYISFQNKTSQINHNDGMVLFMK